MVKKLITKIKNKIKNKNSSFLDEEYKFSLEEIEDLKEQNKKKLENLKQDKKERKKVNFTSVSKKLDGILENNNEEIPIKENNSSNESIEDDRKGESIKITEESKEEIIEKKDTITEETEQQEEQPAKEETSYVNLNKKTQDIIMQKWNNIDLQQIDKDIIEGKDLLNHNYNITYGENAAKFVHDIRKRYEIVICYLIGFNNEKKGIPNKTIFANKVDDEWKYLSNYIKLLEKIRSNRK